MRTEAQRPLWFVPTGTEKPAHIPAGVAALAVRSQSLPEGWGQGVLYGKTPDRALTEMTWQTHADGWKVCMDGVGTYGLQRLAVRPHCIEISDDLQRVWKVPHLLRISDSGDFIATGSRYWDGNGWSVSGDLAGITERLRAFVTGAEFSEAEGVELAVDILAINYHVTMLEMIGMQALRIDEVTGMNIAIDTILAAAGRRRGQ